MSYISPARLKLFKQEQDKYNKTQFMSKTRLTIGSSDWTSSNHSVTMADGSTDSWTENVFTTTVDGTELCDARLFKKQSDNSYSLTDCDVNIGYTTTNSTLKITIIGPAIEGYIVLIGG